MALNFLNNGYFGGKLGIGTVSPNYKLAVYGSSADSEIVASFGSGNDQNEYTAIGLSGFIASNGATKAGIALKRTSVYGTGELHFLNNNTLNNSDMTLSDSKMMINASGNVGIGGIPAAVTHNPHLDIVGNRGTLTVGTGYFEDNGTTNFLNGARPLAFGTGGAEKMRVTSAGSVGIGNITPIFYSGYSSITLGGTYGTTKGLIKFGTGTSNDGPEIFTNTSKDLYFNKAGSGTNMVLYGTGTVRFNNYNSANQTGTPTYILGTDASGNVVKVLGGDIPGVPAGSGTTNYLARWTPDGDTLGVGVVYDNGTNVGIGTTSPLAKLQVGLSTSNSGSTLAMFGAANSGILSALSLVNTTGNNAIGYGTALDFHMNSSYSPTARIASIRETSNVVKAGLGFFTYEGGLIEKMRITNDGNVGIGTTSPGSKLEISSTSDALLELNGGTTANPYMLFAQNGTRRAFIQYVNGGLLSLASEYGDIRFMTGTGGTETEKMRIDSSGNVMIGNTGAGAKLDVRADTGYVFRTENASGNTFRIEASSGNIYTTGDLYIEDNNKIRLGASSDLQIYHSGTHSFIDGSNGAGSLYIRPGSGGTIQLETTTGTDMIVGASSAVTLYSSGNSKLSTGAVGVGTATTAGGTLIDGWITTTQANAIDNTTIATTAYVNNKIALIPAGLVFQGTWNAATNTPTLTSGSGTTGHFYIVSTSGSTNLDGITDWVTGDWAVFVEVGATDAWQKIDNSSVLDGSGTGQTLPLWSGSGTSNTLTDSLVSQPDTTTVQLNNADLKIVNDLQTGGNGKARIKFSEDATNNSMDIYYDGDGQTGDANYTSIFSHKAGIGDVLVTTYGGNVGIGVTGPGEKLEIAGSLLLANNNDIKFNNSAGNKISAIRYNSSNQLIIANGNSPNGDIHFQSDVTSGLMMILDGATDYVGIGNNTSPKSMLDVQGGIKMADDTDTASATKVGTMRYRTGTEYVEVTGVELVTNGDFATDTGWVKTSAAWTISGGSANASNSVSYSRITQAGAPITTTTLYRLIFTVSVTSGTVVPIVGSQLGGQVSASGTYTQYLTSTATTTLVQIASNPIFTGSIDNVSIMEVTAEDASYADMCMQTGASTYEWVNIVRNTY